MKIISGNLLTSTVPVIVHQCNCFHTMGSGIAKILKEEHPEVFEADLTTKFGDKSKLGTFSKAQIKNHVSLKYVFNLYSQYNFGKGLRTDYLALEEGFAEILYWCSVHNIKRIGIPYLIGCGLAGGDENTVLSILEKVQKETPEVEIEIYKLEN